MSDRMERQILFKTKKAMKNGCEFFDWSDNEILERMFEWIRIYGDEARDMVGFIALKSHALNRMSKQTGGNHDSKRIY